MKKLFTLFAILFAVVAVNAQYYFDDVESYTDFTVNPTDIWTFNDVDQSETYGFSGIAFDNSGAAMSFIVFNPTTCSPVLEVTPYSGNKFFACFASTTPPNNDWLISPELNGAAGCIAFYAASYTADYGLERVKVGYSTTTNDPSAFTFLNDGDYLQVPVDWTNYQYWFPAGTRYVAINCVSNDAFILFLDDISVSAGTSIESVNSTSFSIYPNPVKDVLNVDAEGYNNIQIVNILGQVVYTNALTGNHTQVDVQSFNNGVYFVRLSGENGVRTQKFVKK